MLRLVFVANSPSPSAAAVGARRIAVRRSSHYATSTVNVSPSTCMCRCASTQAKPSPKPSTPVHAPKPGGTAPQAKAQQAAKVTKSAPTATADAAGVATAGSTSESLGTRPSTPSKSSAESDDAATPGASEFLHLTVASSSNKQPLHTWLRSLYPHVRLPYSRLTSLCESGTIKLVSPLTAKVKPNQMLKEGMSIQVPATLVATKQKGPQEEGEGEKAASSSPSKHSHAPAACSLTRLELIDFFKSVVHEDQDLLILNKPCGLSITRPRERDKRLWLVGMLPWLLAPGRRLRAINMPPTIPMPPPSVEATKGYRVMTYLEKGVSGCVLIAKNQRTAKVLEELLEPHAEDEKTLRHPLATAAHSSSNQPTQYTVTSDPPVYSEAVWDLPSEEAVWPDSTSESTDTDPQQRGSPSSAAFPPLAQPFLQIRYLGVVHGSPDPKNGAIFSSSPPSRSCFRTISPQLPNSDAPLFAQYAYVSMVVQEGEKKVLRKHMAAIGCPIVGEKKLSELHVFPREDVEEAQYQISVGERVINQYLRWHHLRPLPLFLHANSITIHHPAINRGRPLSVGAKPPQVFRQLITTLFTNGDPDEIEEEEEED